MLGLRELALACQYIHYLRPQMEKREGQGDMPLVKILTLPVNYKKNTDNVKHADVTGVRRKKLKVYGAVPVIEGEF